MLGAFTHTHLFIYYIVGYFYYFHPGLVQLIMAQGQDQAARDTNIQSYPEKCPSTHISGRSLMITLEVTIKKEGHRNNLPVNTTGRRKGTAFDMRFDIFMTWCGHLTNLSWSMEGTCRSPLIFRDFPHFLYWFFTFGFCLPTVSACKKINQASFTVNVEKQVFVGLDSATIFWMKPVFQMTVFLH